MIRTAWEADSRTCVGGPCAPTVANQLHHEWQSASVTLDDDVVSSCDWEPLEMSPNVVPLVARRCATAHQVLVRNGDIKRDDDRREPTKGADRGLREAATSASTAIVRALPCSVTFTGGNFVSPNFPATDDVPFKPDPALTGSRSIRILLNHGRRHSVRRRWSGTPCQ